MKKEPIRKPVSIDAKIEDHQLSFSIRREPSWIGYLIFILFMVGFVCNYNDLSAYVSILIVVATVVTFIKIFNWVPKKGSRKSIHERMKTLTQIHVDRNRLWASYKGLFYRHDGKTIEFDAAEIVQASVSERHVFNKQRSTEPEFRLMFHLKDGTNKIFLSDLKSRAEALYLGHVIVGFLNKKDISVYDADEELRPIYQGMSPWVYKRNFFFFTEDLTVIKGIGPFLEFALNCNQIFTYSELKKSSPIELKKMLKAKNPVFQMHDCSTWPAQAALADAGKWEELEGFQSGLTRGR